MQGPLGWNWVNLAHIVYKVIIDGVYDTTYRNLFIIHGLFNIGMTYYSPTLVGWIWVWWYGREDEEIDWVPKEDPWTPLRAARDQSFYKFA